MVLGEGANSAQEEAEDMSQQVEPYLIPVPDLLSQLIDDLVEIEVQRRGCRADPARRAVEALVLQRGIQAAQTEAMQ